jgi:hypothetical protein
MTTRSAAKKRKEPLAGCLPASGLRAVIKKQRREAQWARYFTDPAKEELWRLRNKKQVSLIKCLKSRVQSMEATAKIQDSLIERLESTVQILEETNDRKDEIIDKLDSEIGEIQDRLAALEE